MSYILDALKKAERERDIAQIPTLTTVHDMPTKQGRRHVRLILGACLVCAALLAWIGFLLLKPGGNPASQTATIRGTAEQPGATPSQAFRREEASGQMIPYETDEAGTSSITSSGKSTAAARSAAPGLIQKPSAATSHTQKESNPPQAPMRVITPEAPEAPSAPAIAPSKPLPLREAVSKMNMTILFYAEAGSERMVFINDRKYVEGDYVDGLYLLESITPEGAWLTYQGERTILRAKSK